MNRKRIVFQIIFLCTLVHTIVFSQNNSVPMALSNVKYWGYQIQSIRAQDAVENLVTSHYDMLVLEPTRTDWSSNAKLFNTAEMVTNIKNSFASDGIHRKLVIAYIDIGEAEDWRWYWNWSLDWNCEQPIPNDWPDYIITCDPDGWGGNYPVAYWDSLWQDIVIWGENQNSNPYGNYSSIIDEVISDGFDGIYLDWVEAFEDTSVMKIAQTLGKNPADEMISFIEEMIKYAKNRNPNFIIIQQNAASLCDEHPELFNVIDAIAQEAIWYDGNATDIWNNPSGHDFLNDHTLTQYYLNYLSMYQAAGIPVFNCEYALANSDSAYAKSYRNGFIPYATRRSLGKLTSTPPPEYSTVNVDNNSNVLPKNIQLEQNYPNPFNPSTMVKYGLPEQSNVKIEIFNMLGQSVGVLVNSEKQAGFYETTWNAENLSSGIYLISIKANGLSSNKNFVQVKKALLLK